MAQIHRAWHAVLLLAGVLSLPPRTVIDANQLTVAIIHDDKQDLHLRQWMFSIQGRLLSTVHDPVYLEWHQVPCQVIQHDQMSLKSIQQANIIVIASRCPAATEQLTWHLYQIGDYDHSIIPIDWSLCNENQRHLCLDQTFFKVETSARILRLGRSAPSNALPKSSPLHEGIPGVSKANANGITSINGQTLRLATVERPPFVIFKRDASGNVFSYSGICFEIVNLLAEVYNFTYTVQYPPDNTYGTEMADGSWNGMIGMILAGQIDVGVAPFSVTYSRHLVVDFSTAYYEESTAILIPPPTQDTRLFACTKPFQLQVWLTLLLVMIVLPLIMWAHHRLLWKMGHSESAASDRQPPNLYLQFLFVFSVITTQSGRRVPSIGHSPRLLAAVWCLSTVIFIYLYVGTLMSFLSVPKLRPIISRLEDLPSSSLSWGVRAGTVLETLFTDSSEGLYRIIAEQLIRHPESVTRSDAEGIQRVANGSFAFIKEKSFLEFAIQQDLIDTDQCRLSIAKEEFFKANFALALTKNKQLEPLLSRKIQQMIEAGLGEYWRKKYGPAKNRCEDLNQPISTARRLTLDDLQSAFLVLAIGIALAFVAFIGEGTVALILTH